jgi:amino acid transporter
VSTTPTRPPLLLRERSEFDGLDRRVVTRGDLVAHSVAVVCPSASALSTAFMLPHLVGPGAWLSVVVGVGLSWLLAVSFGEFGSRFTAPGSLYTYTAKGLGATAALVVGCALLFGYGALVSYGLTDSSKQVGRSLEALTGRPHPVALGFAAVLAGTLVCVLVMRRGIRWSTRFAFATEAVALSLLVLILVMTALRSGLSASVLSLEGASPSRVLVGAAVIMTITVGFESAAALGVEGRRPFHSIPWSMRTSVLITGVLVLAGVLVGSAATGDRQRGRWFAPGADVSVLDAGALLVVAASYLACGLCAWTALTRLLFAFGREGLLPAFLGRTDPRSLNPANAVAVTLPVVLLPTLVSLVAGQSPGWASYQLLISATVILFVAYGLTALSVVPFLHRLGELSPGRATIALGATVGVAVLAWIDLDADLGDGELDMLLTLVGVVLVGLAWRVLLGVRRPATVARIGTHEAPLVSEVLVPGHGESWDGLVRCE